MRLSALLLLLVPLFSCEEEATKVVVRISKLTVHTSGNEADCKPCEAATSEESNEVCEALNGECASYKDSVMKCCEQRASCLAKIGDPRIVPATNYTQCGKEQATCIDGINFDLGFCEKRATSIKVHAVSKGTPGIDFLLRPKLGVTKELYGNCTAATVTIDDCATKLKECEVKHANRPKAEGGADVEPYECANQGTNCLEHVMDIDRTLQCALELGFATEVMRRRWKKTVDGKEDSVSRADPFNTIIEFMMERWDLSWWGAFGIIVGSTLGLTAVLCCVCYCCAMMQLTRQKAQRRWERQQDRKERGADRYSNVESGQSSSVRISRYSREEDE